ncbi:uncharacterized protein J7T54_007985 [Emericellopsis cladophorae]|uniref:Uncharacterized protein n=1 Tax=Emericellopsis cladophorae TaxID=2686198 RepID=A0A9P9Y7J2_9HYPO|nr:uncharacterized protein J7T54_007985 [Emericellopsis cladophorae]KAI6784891.1 hypothetical protein J7T54_007985 [Emericellopsis cladophorae]
MAFLEDPRLRQRWNQITQDAEAATENAAAGIWSFQQHYVNPCLGSVAASIQSCTAVCIGDAEDRLRRRRERERERAEYSFDFYDDWYEEEEQAGGILGGWGGEDWDRLLAGTGSQKKHHAAGATAEQPKRKRGMSYGTKGGRRPSRGEDPTIIPSTQPIGFLSKLPFRMGGTLRYKPSAANLQEHPGKPDAAEAEPLLGSDSSSDAGHIVRSRKRSGTAGSGDTSDSYRSRGDLFPSDGEGEEDAVPLDDDVTYDMVRKDDRSSCKTRSSKGKRPALSGSRTVSRTTLGSNASRDSLRLTRVPSGLSAFTPDAEAMPSLEDMQMEEEHLRMVEDEKIAKSRQAAAHLARARGLRVDSPELQPSTGQRMDVAPDEVYEPAKEAMSVAEAGAPLQPDTKSPSKSEERDEFVPARLPRFG